MTPNHQQFMEMALEEARLADTKGNIPVGCVIVRDGEVITGGHNETTSMHDLTAHAETVALRKARPALGAPDLSGCTLYTTLEPCPMCCGAIMVARVSTLILGGRPNPGESIFWPYSVERLLELAQWGSRLTVVTGVLQDKGAALVNDWRRRQSLG